MQGLLRLVAPFFGSQVPIRGGGGRLPVSYLSQCFLPKAVKADIAQLIGDILPTGYPKPEVDRDGEGAPAHLEEGKEDGGLSPRKQTPLSPPDLLPLEL